MYYVNVFKKGNTFWLSVCYNLTVISLKHIHLTSHFMCVCVLVTQSCSTLCNPTDSTVHRILKARILEWVAISFSRASSPRRDGTWVSCIAGRIYHLSHQENQSHFILASTFFNEKSANILVFSPLNIKCIFSASGCFYDFPSLLGF